MITFLPSVNYDIENHKLIAINKARESYSLIAITLKINSLH